MKKFRKIVSLAMACIMALCFMTACGGGGGGGGSTVDPAYARKSTYEKQQIEAINSLRDNIGQNTLTWNASMDNWAEDYLDVWAAYQTNQLRDDEYNTQISQVMNKYNNVATINGKTIACVHILLCCGELVKDDYSNQAPAVITLNATYVGNATKTVEGRMYGIVIIAK